MLQINNLYATTQFLPGTGRWQSAGLTEGADCGAFETFGPSTTPQEEWGAVPLPVPGRN